MSTHARTNKGGGNLLKNLNVLPPSRCEINLDTNLGGSSLHNPGIKIRNARQSTKL